MVEPVTPPDVAAGNLGREGNPVPVAASAWWVGVLVTALAAGLFEFLSSRLIFIPNPPAILIAAVVFAAFHGGLRAGLISAAIAWLYFALFFSIPGEPFRYAGDNLARVLVWAVATPAIAVMTGLLRQRSERLLHTQKVNTLLAMHLKERVAAVDAMHRLNEQMRLVTDNAPTQVAGFDASWRCQFANAAYARWFGLETEAMAGKHVREIVGEAMFAEIEPLLRRVSTGERVPIEGPRTRADGSVRSVEGNLTPRIDLDGTFGGCYVFFNDVTEKLQAEDALRKKSLELGRIVESMAQGLVMFDRDGRFVLMNAAAERLFGVARDRVLGLRVDEAPWRRVRGDEAIAAHDLPFERLRRGENRVEDYELDAILADGRRVSLVNSSIALRDAHGEFLGSVTTYFDVTARKAAEAALGRKSAELTNLIETMAEGVVMFDADGRYVLVNAAAERIFGVPRERIFGLRLDEVPWKRTQSDGSEIGRQGTPFERLRRGEAGVAGWEIGIVRLDGRSLSLEISSVALRDAEGRFAGVISTFSDVTARKQAETAVRLAKSRLDRALEGGQLALFDLDVATGAVYLSEGWAAMIGAEPGETHTSVGELLEMVHPEHREEVWNLAMAALKGESHGYDVEHRIRRRDGEWIWILSRCRAERDASGRSVRMSGTNLDITERKHAEQRMHYLATRDALTDLSNRALFGDGLQEAIAAAAAESGRIALMSIGLDRFTTINDSLGQHAGDLVLKRIADRISAAAGAGNAVARPGGDEFLVLMPRLLSTHAAAGCADNILAGISQPIAVEGRNLVVTASIGVALFPEDGESAGVLLRNADIALHHAKDAGRDNVQFFAETMNVAARSRLENEAAMRRGLEGDEFVVYYQPQVALATGALIGFEALVRWQDPERGLISPGEFLPVAESTGLIVALGERVLAKACAQAAAWQRLSATPLRIGVNVTARQFRQKGFVKAVKAAVAAAHLDPRLLELEIIENAIMEHGPETIAILEALGNMGVQLAIDDFGTGYSSLSYLKRLPIDTVKIDQSFVADLPGDPDAGAIVGAIIALAHNLGLKVLAEGVETRAQATYLRDHGCDHAQGYYFGRPQPPELQSVGEGGKVLALKRDGAA